MSSDTAKKRFKQLCRDAARSLGVAPDHDRATAAATLKLMFEQLQVRLLEGERIDPSILLKLTDAIMEIAPPVPPKVKLEIVDSVGPSETPKPPLDTQRDSKRTENVPIENRTALADAPESANPADDSKVVEIEVRKPLWANTGKTESENFVPAQPFGDGSPTAPDHGREVWRNHARSAVGLGAYGPDPSPYHVLHSPGHPLPRPNGGGQ
jgi:hypothetical protein